MNTLLQIENLTFVHATVVRTNVTCVHAIEFRTNCPKFVLPSKEAQAWVPIGSHTYDLSSPSIP
jgi:hypothetical protein